MKRLRRVNTAAREQLNYHNSTQVERNSLVEEKVDAPSEEKHLSKTIKFGKYRVSPLTGIETFKDKKNSEYQKIAEYTRVSTIIRDITTNTESYEIEYYRASSHKIEHLIVPGDTLTGIKIDSLVKYGLDVHAGNRQSISAVLVGSRNYAKTLNTYNHYGWSEILQQKVFLHSNAISSNGRMEDYKLDDSAKINLTPEGTFEEWLLSYKENVKGKTPLEFAVVLGCSAPIVAYLSDKHDDLKTLFVNITGQSSQGKTTMTMLALSTAGNPSTRNNGLLKTWNSTQNAITGQLNDVKGIPIAFDELSMSSSKNLTALLYSMTEGKQKARLKKDGSQRETAEWATTIISNGEVSLFNRLDNNLGLRVRILEFAHVVWTESAEQSEVIKQTVNKNYGHLVPLFVNKLLIHGLKIIDQEFEIQRKDILEKIPKSPTTDRISIKLAAITTTASLLKKLEILDINIPALQNFLIENDRENFDSRDMATKALDDVSQYLVANQSKLLRENSSHTPYEVMGKLSIKLNGSKKIVEVAIITNQFAAMMEELNYQDAKIVIKEWQRKDILKTEGDRLTIRKLLPIDGKQERVTTYTFEIPEEYHDLLLNLSRQESIPVASSFTAMSLDNASKRIDTKDLQTITEQDFEL